MEVFHLNIAREEDFFFNKMTFSTEIFDRNKLLYCIFKCIIIQFEEVKPLFTTNHKVL